MDLVKKGFKIVGIVVGVLVALLILARVVMEIGFMIDTQATVRVLNPTHPGEALVGKPAPDFTLPHVGKSETSSLSDYRGKVVILDYWASWCAPCKRTSPKIDAVRKRHDDVVVLALNVREDDELPEAERTKAALGYIEETGYGFVQLQGNQALMDDYKTKSIPQLFVINPEGIVTYSGVGMHDEQNLEDAIATARSVTDG